MALASFKKGPHGGPHSTRAQREGSRQRSRGGPTLASQPPGPQRQVAGDTAQRELRAGHVLKSLARRCGKTRVGTVSAEPSSHPRTGRKGDCTGAAGWTRSLLRAGEALCRSWAGRLCPAGWGAAPTAHRPNPCSGTCSPWLPAAPSREPAVQALALKPRPCPSSCGHSALLSGDRLPWPSRPRVSVSAMAAVTFLPARPQRLPF